MRQNGSWQPLTTACLSTPPEVAAQPIITPALVLSALRRVGLPALAVRTQPEDKTLVNFETIFYTESATVSRDLTLLGQSVHVEATPSTYSWSFGDGTGATTSTPGDRYPAKTIVHKYTDAAVTVHPVLTATYTARFTVNGGTWQDVDGTVTVTGPPAALRIVEATPVLSGNHG